MLNLAALQQAISGQLGILMAVFASVFLAAVGTWLIVGERREMRRRLAATGQREAAQADLSIRRARQLSGFWQFTEKIGRPFFKRAKSEDISELRMRLIHAGFINPRAMAVYFGLRIVLALVLPAVVALFLPRFLPSTPPAIVGLAVLVTCVIGYYIPVLYVTRRIRRRREEIRYSFPDALDMLLVCVESGLGLDAAVSRVAQEMGPAHPILAENLNWLSHELRVGRDRNVALRGLAERTGVDDVSSLVTLLIQTDQLGTSMAEALRSHAYEMRASRMLRAEEKAQKMPIKLSAIIVFLVLPALMLFIMSPAILSIAYDVLPKMQGGAAFSAAAQHAKEVKSRR